MILQMAAPAPWRPDADLADFAAEQFDAEGRATDILKVGVVVLVITLSIKITTVLQEGNINSEVARLTAALASLDLTIQTHVSAHYTDLLDHAVASRCRWLGWSG